MGSLQGSYWFTRGGLWFFETPVMTCLGWFFIAYSSVLIADKIFPKTSLIGRAGVGAMIAFLIDLWMDPAITSPENMAWVWGKGASSLLIFGIPLQNFMAWFLLVFLFAIFWEKLPVIEEKFGRLKANKIFFVTCIIGAYVTYLFLGASWYMTGIILSGLGAPNVVSFPPGW